MKEQQTHGFVVGDSMHLSALLCSAVTMVACIVAGKQFQKQGWEQRFTRSLAWFGLVLWGVAQIYALLPNRFESDSSLPLHWCDAAALIIPLALLTGARRLRAVTYFWAFAFTPLAFITPTLEEGPGELMFWLFWLSHTVIVAYALYDIIVLRFRPGWKDFATNTLVASAFVIFLLVVNIPNGWNYGFVGNSMPDVKTPMDALGSWPLRVIWIFLIAHVVFVIMVLPWRLCARFCGSKSPPVDAGRSS